MEKFSKYIEILKEQKKKPGPKSKGGDDEIEGVRDITFTATIKIDGKRKTEKKELKKADASKVDQLTKAYEAELNKKYDFEADIEIEVSIGGHSASDKAENYRTNDDDADNSIRSRNKK